MLSSAYETWGHEQKIPTFSTALINMSSYDEDKKRKKKKGKVENNCVISEFPSLLLLDDFAVRHTNVFCPTFLK